MATSFDLCVSPPNTLFKMFTSKNLYKILLGGKLDKYLATEIDASWTNIKATSPCTSKCQQMAIEFPAS